jgi:pimeloyl-ACP methyl ester carboxylesterase
MVFPVNGIDLVWEETGEGEPLLWLHGGLGVGADWKFIFEDAPPGYRVIAPDLRGHGGSTDPTGSFTFRRCAEDIRALLRHLRIPQVKAIGLSGGGIVLLHMATLEPASISAMAVVSAPPYFPEQARKLQRQLSPDTLGETEMARMRERHKGGEPQLRQLFDIVHRMAEDHDDVNFTLPALSTITADTLIVFGDRDPLYPVSIAFELHRAIQNSHLWVVPNGGHGPVFGPAAAHFSKTVMAFLAGKWRPPPA